MIIDKALLNFENILDQIRGDALMAHGVSSGVFVVAAALAAAGAVSAQNVDAPVVRIGDGLIRGSVDDDVAAFKGIPFARPPVGDLRWVAPQPVESWDDVRAAEAFGNDCFQAAFSFDASPSTVPYSEDCLYLNVWAPADAAPGDGLPVLFWLYGGGFVNGGTSPAVHDGAAFARDGVIFVSANYRLGRFGFFAHPALTAENADGLLGNYAGFDMVAALQWVQTNIAAFGGDPGRVTIAGESSGGVAVQALATSPMAEGLFAGAIIQSGTDGRSGQRGMLPTTAPEGEPSGELVGVMIAESLGIEESGPEALAALRALPAELVGGGLSMATMREVLAVPATLDGRLLLDSPGQLMREGKAADVPYLIGATDADAFFYGDSLDDAYAPLAARRAEAEALYGPAGNGDARTIGTLIRADQQQNEPARYFAGLLAGQGRDVWVYRFSYVPESLEPAPGAGHGSDVAFAFDTIDAVYGDAVTRRDRAAAEVAHAYWVQFAKTGTMAPLELPALPPYDAAAPEIIEFTADGPVVGPDPAQTRLDFIESTVVMAQ
jgi:para-nitrobenzyl esterase